MPTQLIPNVSEWRLSSPLHAREVFLLGGAGNQPDRLFFRSMSFFIDMRSLALSSPLVK